ncbi:5129_t:CDS:1 [Ambispora leptoticha]|uniref:5129_t:CDS:1 n=1 Tax=Ambispora leptoticha TaxID=144679 RepID=A0A9N9BM11_9GLOM|nr:5129_t:CDS:1 [Ambispora leptoticha]
MTFISYIAFSIVCVIILLSDGVLAHSSMKYPLPRGHPLNPQAPKKDYACITAPLNGGPDCPKKPFPCGGYPVDTKVTQVFHAGEVINVKFYNPNFPGKLTPADTKRDQARHNGGLCEFSLSYDGGKSYTVIATYHRTCPDIFFDWKVKIPEAAPSCDTRGKCIFSWSWIDANGNREFYQNCADVKIVGNATKPLPVIDITRANLPPEFKKIITPVGDPSNTDNAKGSGPLPSDVSANLALHIGSSGNGKSNPTSSAPKPSNKKPKDGKKNNGHKKSKKSSKSSKKGKNKSN